MKPLSAIYYIKKNKMRCFLTIFIFVLTYVIYIGGLYFNNIEQTFEYSIERLDKFAAIQPNGTGVKEKFEQSKLKSMEDDRLLVIEQLYGGGVYINSIMGSVKNGYPTFSFKSVEDFKSYCEYMNISCDFESLKEGSAVMSEMFALNRGLERGELVTADEAENEVLYGDFILDAITDEEGYSFYTIGGADLNTEYLILPVEMDLEQFGVFLKELSDDYDVTAVNGEYLEEEIARQMSSMNKIYFFIVIFTAVVIAVTINAVFVGMYQKREAEYAVYRAIGIGRKRIRRKLICEILVMDLIGLLIGGIVCITALYLLNSLYFHPSGRHIFYYHPISLIGMLVCNGVVLIPLIFTRSRQLMRADICTF